jgi:protocatechuate 4,5-dioxygenase beta chain
MTHRPTIYRNWDSAPEAAKNSALESFSKLRKRLEESSPDSIVLIANDHIDQFFLDNMPSFCVGISNKAQGPFPIEHEQGIPTYAGAVNEDLSRFVLREGIRSNLDFARISDFRLDHAFVVPLSFLSPVGQIPIVPIFTNVLVPPIPSMQRFHYLGRVISKAIEQYRGNEKIAVIGSINLSLDLAGPRHARSDDEFDDLALNLMKTGTPDEFYDKMDLRRIFRAGNATAEFLNYLSLLGVVGDTKPELVECPRVPRWGTCPTVAWNM